MSIMERKYFIDNLRWMAILLLFPFHTAQIWSGGEYSGFYIWSHTNTVLYAFSTAVYPWYMTLLFTIAGISCRYALQKRSNRQFIVERTKKLLIPFFFGVLILVPIMTYIAEVFFYGYTGSYLNQYILFFTKKTDLTGYHGGFTPAHLWFLLYLYIISLMALCIASGGIYTYLYCFENLRNEWMTGLYVFYGWMGIITLLGIGQAKLNFHNR